VNFSEVYNSLVENKQLRARNFNWGKSEFVYIESNKVIPNEVLREPVKSWFGEYNMVIIPHFNKVLNSGMTIVGWLPDSHELHSGWELIEDEDDGD